MVLSICFVTGQLGLGGAERQLYLLAKALVARGHVITVITFHAHCGDYWEGPLTDLGIALIRLCPSTGRMERIKVIARALRTLKADVVHSWTFSANLYAAIAGRLAGTPMRLGSERSIPAASLEALGRFWYAASLWGLHGVTTNNEFAAARMRRTKPRLPVHTVRNGVEFSVTALWSPDEKNWRRRELGLLTDAIVVGAVGSHVPSKNFGQLIEAGARLVPKHPDLVILFWGDGPLRRELEATARRLVPGRVVFGGAVPGAGKMLGVLDVLCLPAIGFEGLPNVLIEAAAAGVPAVASRVGGSGEVVEHAVTGYLFAEGDTDELTHWLGVLCGDRALRQSLGRNARAKAEKEYQVDSMVNAMEKIYSRSPDVAPGWLTQ
jgi:glycosyltransferase involved in cell wall biosynthesis